MQSFPESSAPQPISRPKRRLSGFTWILIGITGIFVVGLLISTLRRQQAPQPRIAEAPPEIYFGVHEFINAGEDGVTFNDVYPPDSPADKAGLVGGDIITTFDGHPIKEKSAMLAVLRQMPAGKTSELIYLRDGEKKKTNVTTISAEQFRQLEENFENRKGGQGQLGFEDHSSRVVQIEGTNISGVQLNDLSSSGPAALAGIQEGDVVIEFDGAPIRKRGELVMRVRRATPYSTVKVVVMRNTQKLEIPVKIGKRGQF